VFLDKYEGKNYTEQLETNDLTHLGIRMKEIFIDVSQ